MSAKNYGNSASYQRQEQAYRQKALKLFPWICGRCAREFSYSKLRELTVHHIDHDHHNNPDDGSNWELLCLYCHDMEHAKYIEYGMENGKQKPVASERESATFKPFENLKDLLAKK